MSPSLEKKTPPDHYPGVRGRPFTASKHERTVPTAMLSSDAKLCIMINVTNVTMLSTAMQGMCSVEL